MKITFGSILAASLAVVSHAFAPAQRTAVRTTTTTTQLADRPPSNVSKEEMIWLLEKHSPRTVSPDILSRRGLLKRSTMSIISAVFVTQRFTDKPAFAVAAESNSNLCDPTVSTFRDSTGERLVHIIGTAHISEDSALLVGRVIGEVKPDAVFVELDAKRVKMGMKNAGDEAVENVKKQSSIVDPAPADSVAKKRIGLLDFKGRALETSSKAVGNAISGLYKKLESQGFSAGEEFSIAM